MVRLQDVISARKIIEDIIHKTPVFTSSFFDEKCGRKLFFKCELFQKTGSFKARGALHTVLSLQSSKNKLQGVVLSLQSSKNKLQGVVTHSSGNHGQALAWAARVAGVPCTVVVPSNSARSKVKAIQGYGAELVYCEPNFTARTATCARIASEKQYEIVPPFDHPSIIAGQGTLGLEFLEQVPDLDAILVPISGGGMTAGIAAAVKELKPDIKVFACEPEGKDLEPSLRAGERLWSEPAEFIDTIADGLRVQQLGHLTFPLVQELCEKDVFTVSDAEIIPVMKLVYERMKLVIEPSSAVGVAAVLSDRFRTLDPALTNVGVILCGGNVDIEKLPW